MYQCIHRGRGRVWNFQASSGLVLGVKCFVDLIARWWWWIKTIDRSGEQLSKMIFWWNVEGWGMRLWSLINVVGREREGLIGLIDREANVYPLPPTFHPNQNSAAPYLWPPCSIIVHAYFTARAAKSLNAPRRNSKREFKADLKSAAAFGDEPAPYFVYFAFMCSLQRTLVLLSTFPFRSNEKEKRKEKKGTDD